MTSKRFENTLFAILALIVGGTICSYYTSSLPDFDIGGNKAWITLECRGLTWALWGILWIVFRCIGKERNDGKEGRVWKAAAVMIYGLMVWGYCYYQCAVKAIREWNDMLNGNVG